MRKGVCSFPMGELNKLTEFIADLDENRVFRFIDERISKGEDVSGMIAFLTKGMHEAGQRFSSGEYYLPELVLCAEIMTKALEKINPLINKSIHTDNCPGRIVIGTVKGDVHDIGKNLVKSVLVAGGYDVLDLGINVSNETFVQKAEEYGANIIATSALLTTTMPQQSDLVKYLEENSIRSRYKVIVGGAPVTRNFALSIGADGYAEDAFGALREVNRLVGVTDEPIKF